MTSLRNVGAIISKEWRHYFSSPIAYVALVAWLLVFGGFFSVVLQYFTMASADPQAMQYGQKLSLNDLVFRGLLQNMGTVALFMTPMLTMRLFAEEKRQGTIELLATAPLTDWQIVIGKFLGAWSVFLLMIVLGFLNFLWVFRFATNKPEWKPLLTGALGLWLLAGAFIALGLFLSTLTRNQIIAGILTFGALLLLLILQWVDTPTANPILKACAQVAPMGHIEDMVKGVIDLKDLVFFASFIGFGLFVTQQSLESQRWRA